VAAVCNACLVKQEFPQSFAISLGKSSECNGELRDGNSGTMSIPYMTETDERLSFNKYEWRIFSEHEELQVGQAVLVKVSVL
jgi:hypothetical protein